MILIVRTAYKTAAKALVQIVQQQYIWILQSHAILCSQYCYSC